MSAEPSPLPNTSNEAESVTRPPAEAGDSIDLLAGTPPTVPGYEILRELGRGGMGVVYKARQTGLNRIVALKVILSGAHAGERELARFRLEAEAIGRLQHQNIVQVYEAGGQNGLPYFSMEYCAGGSLKDRLVDKPLLPKDAARLVETLARAVHAAHQAGIVHRDLTSANVSL
jgi:serine/threonine protein kinase